MRMGLTIHIIISPVPSSFFHNGQKLFVFQLICNLYKSKQSVDY
jgi:hypothetical protein